MICPVRELCIAGLRSLIFKAFLEKELPPDLWQKFIDFQPKDKLASIIEMIEAAKARNHG